MEVLILTGACGVGKSSTAKEWAKRKNGAVIECDCFSHTIHKKDFPKWTIVEEKLIAKLAIANALLYLKEGMAVAINYVWTPVGIQMLKDGLSKEKLISSLKFVWLFCDLEENHKRDEQRILSHQMKERVDVVNKKLGGYDWQKFVKKIDTTEITTEEVCDFIVKDY